MRSFARGHGGNFRLTGSTSSSRLGGTPFGDRERIFSKSFGTVRRTECIQIPIDAAKSKKVLGLGITRIDPSESVVAGSTCLSYEFSHPSAPRGRVMAVA
jgi:hypothetical protein